MEKHKPLTQGNGGRHELAPWRPYGEFGRLENEMTRMLGEFVRHPFGLPALFEREPLPHFGFRGPAVELSQTDDELVVKAELPGMKRHQIDVHVAGDLLTLRGEKKEEEEGKARGYTFSERSYGSFTRALRLPAPIQPDKVKAHFRDGVLEIHLPKTDESRRKETKVTIEE